MTQHTKYLLLFALFFVIVGCKDDNVLSLNTSEIKRNPQNKQTDTIIWKFFNVYPIGKGASNKIAEIQTTYRNIAFEINNDKVYINNIGSENLYINNLTSEKYFRKEYLKSFYEKLFLEKLNLSLPDSLLVLRNKNSHKQNSILKPYFDDAFIADKYLIIQKNGYALFFEKALSKEESSIFVENQNSNFPKEFKELLNRKLVGITVINEKSKNLYKKYGLDFSTVCHCDAPSFYINDELTNITVFNYCDNGKIPNNLNHSYNYKIVNKEYSNSQIELTTSPYLKFIFNKIENAPIYKLKIEGDFPKEHIGNDLKKLFTSEPEKFKAYDCGDYGG